MVPGTGMRRNVAVVLPPKCMFVRHRTSKRKEHDGGARDRPTVRRSALQGDREQTPGHCARMPVSRSTARDTRSCLPIRTQSRRPGYEERVGWLCANHRLGAIRLLLVAHPRRTRIVTGLGIVFCRFDCLARHWKGTDQPLVVGLAVLAERSVEDHSPFRDWP